MQLWDHFSPRASIFLQLHGKNSTAVLPYLLDSLLSSPTTLLYYTNETEFRGIWLWRWPSISVPCADTSSKIPEVTWLQTAVFERRMITFVFLCGILALFDSNIPWFSTGVMHANLLVIALPLFATFDSHLSFNTTLPATELTQRFDQQRSRKTNSRLLFSTPLYSSTAGSIKWSISFCDKELSSRWSFASESEVILAQACSDLDQYRQGITLGHPQNILP